MKGRTMPASYTETPVEATARVPASQAERKKGGAGKTSKKRRKTKFGKRIRAGLQKR